MGRCCRSCKYYTETNDDPPVCMDEDGLYFGLRVEGEEVCPDWAAKDEDGVKCD